MTQQNAGTKSKSKLASKLKDGIKPYLMIAPATIFLTLFTIYPMLNLVYLSFFDYNLMNPIKKFVGLRNYKILFVIKNDFYIVLRNTAVYTVAVVFFLILLAVVFAVWFQRDTRLNRFAQTALFTPHLIATLSCAMIWSWLMDQNTYGLLNAVLGFFKLGPLKWLNSSDTAMISVVIVSVWKSLGYYILIVLSALKAIPPEIYEAAALDNAPRHRTFFKITLPMISPQLFFLLITITINSFKVFDTIRVMTNGGPGNSTDVLAYYIYREAFTNMKIGLASAAGTVLMGILIIMTAFYFKALQKKVHYQ